MVGMQSLASVNACSGPCVGNDAGHSCCTVAARL